MAKRKNLTLFLAFISFINARAQNEEADTTKVYNFVEITAQFRGGLEALSRFIDQNLKYPAKAKELEIEGTVSVKFIIERDGTITHAEILRGIKELNDEAIRVVMLMPKWKPGKNQGYRVRQSYLLPISFRLPDN